MEELSDNYPKIKFVFKLSNSFSKNRINVLKHNITKCNKILGLNIQVI